MDPVFAMKFFGALFAIMNPITVLPIFLSVTDGVSEAIQRQIALKIALYSLIMGVAIALIGTPALKLFGISIDDFRVAGGLVVLMIGLNMLNGAESSSHHGTAKEKSDYPDPADVAFYPMTFPMIVGPGTITTLILFTGQAHTAADKIAAGGVFLSVIAMLGLVLYFAGDLAKHLSGTARVIMSRLMGMILAAIAIEMIASGLTAILPGLA